MTPEIAEVENVADFLKSEGVKMNVLPAHENPYRVQQQNNLDFHYSCKIINEKNQWFVVYFSKGFLIRTWIQPSVYDLTPSHVPMDKLDTEYDGPQPPFDENTPQADLDTFNYCSRQTPPSLEEVIDCLAKDIRSIELGCGDFEAWCDIMETEKNAYSEMIWQIVTKQRLQLLELLGDGAFHRLIYETEPLK